MLEELTEAVVFHIRAGKTTFWVVCVSSWALWLWEFEWGPFETNLTGFTPMLSPVLWSVFLTVCVFWVQCGGLPMWIWYRECWGWSDDFVCCVEVTEVKDIWLFSLRLCAPFARSSHPTIIMVKLVHCVYLCCVCPFLPVVNVFDVIDSCLPGILLKLYFNFWNGGVIMWAFWNGEICDPCVRSGP